MPPAERPVEVAPTEPYQPGTVHWKAIRAPWLNRIGVELEGGWRRSFTPTASCGTIKTDGSVACQAHNSRRTTKDRLLAGTDAMAQAWRPNGEYVTPAVALAKGLLLVQDYYPDLINSTAGMHVHVSFKDRRHYRQILTEKFEAHFLARWKLWADTNRQRMGEVDYAAFIERWEGKNRYCRRGSVVQAVTAYRDGRSYSSTSPYGDRYSPGQARMDRTGTLNLGGRYHQLNVTNSSGTGTLECRMLPVFTDHLVAIAAIRELIRIIADGIADIDGAACQAVSSGKLAPAGMPGTVKTIGHGTVVGQTRTRVLGMPKDHPLWADAPAGHARMYLVGGSQFIGFPGVTPPDEGF